MSVPVSSSSFLCWLCRGPAHPEKSDGILGDERPAQFCSSVSLPLPSASPDDSFLFPNPWSASSLRSELSLSLSRPERDFHHAAGGRIVKGETKRTTHAWRAPDHRRDRVGFNELAIDCRATPKAFGVAVPRVGKRCACLQ